MAHAEQIEFCTSIKNKFSERFENVSVLDIGSLDINGNNHYLFSNYKYTGIDVGPGKNVDIVSKGHEYKSEDKFDIIISTECFEHDKFYKETIQNVIGLLKEKGLFIFTCATTGRAEHGTSKSAAFANPLASVEFNDYYKNLTEQDIREVINVEDVFSEFEFQVNLTSSDLYFWGIKK